MTTKTTASAGRAPDFLETPYGIVKRLRTVERWAAFVGKSRRTPVLSILDYGCGTGDHVTYPLASLGHRVEDARHRFSLPNLSFRAADIDQLVREGLSFDLVICSEVLEHLHQPLPFLLQIRRLVEPNGGLIVTTPNGYGAFEWLSWLERIVEPLGLNIVMRKVGRAFKRHKVKERMVDQAEPDGATGVGFLNMDSKHVQYFRMTELESLFVRSGFHIIDRQARTLLCGPYVDQIFKLMPFQQTLYDLNNRMADALPTRLAADWMFLLEPKHNG